MLAAAGHGAKICTELTNLHNTNPEHGWNETEKRLVDAGVFEG